MAAPAPVPVAVQPVEGEYLAGQSYRVRYIADERGFRASVVFVGDAGAAAAAAAAGGSKAGTSVVVTGGKPIAVKSTAVQPTGAPAAAVATATADEDEDDYDEDADDNDEDFKPPIVMSSRPSKLQDDDGIGCAIRNSLCG